MKYENNLDEMQEQKLLHIEHNMAWLAFYGLFAAILGQLLLFGPGLTHILGELLVFLGICIYMVIDCVRNGIWDRKIKPTDRKASLSVCLWFCSAFSIVMAVLVYRGTGSLPAALITFPISLAIMMLLCWITLSLITKLYQKRVDQLEDPPNN